MDFTQWTKKEILSLPSIPKNYGYATYRLPPSKIKLFNTPILSELAPDPSFMYTPVLTQNQLKKNSYCDRCLGLLENQPQNGAELHLETPHNYPCPNKNCERVFVLQSHCRIHLRKCLKRRKTPKISKRSAPNSLKKKGRKAKISTPKHSATKGGPKRANPSAGNGAKFNYLTITNLPNGTIKCKWEDYIYYKPKPPDYKVEINGADLEWKCRHCDHDPFTRLAGCLEHELKHLIGDANRYVCGDCNMEIASERGVKSHIHSVHIKDGGGPCTCGKYYSNRTGRWRCQNKGHK
eukprot:40773_1